MRLAVPASISSVRGVFDGKRRARGAHRPSGSRTLGRPVRAREPGPCGPAGSRRGWVHACEVARPRYPAGVWLRTTRITTRGKRHRRCASRSRSGDRQAASSRRHALSPRCPLPEHLPDEAGVDVRIRYRTPVLRGPQVPEGATRILATTPVAPVRRQVDAREPVGQQRGSQVGLDFRRPGEIVRVPRRHAHVQRLHADAAHRFRRRRDVEVVEGHPRLRVRGRRLEELPVHAGQFVHLELPVRAPLLTATPCTCCITHVRPKLNGRYERRCW